MSAKIRLRRAMREMSVAALLAACLLLVILERGNIIFDFSVFVGIALFALCAAPLLWSIWRVTRFIIVD
jgi:hypothetical protein